MKIFFIGFICFTFLIVPVSWAKTKNKKTRSKKQMAMVEVEGIKQGDTVEVEYTGKLDDGTVFDTSVSKEPLKFTLGVKKVIPGFEEAVLGMKQGEKKTTRIPVEKAYGDRRKELIFEIPKEKMPKDGEIKIGQYLRLDHDNTGKQFLVSVKEIKENTVVLDGNHPLAGKDLIFEIKILSIS